MSFNVVLLQLAACYIRYSESLLLLLSSLYPESQVALWVQSHSDGLLAPVPLLTTVYHLRVEISTVYLVYSALRTVANQ